MLGPNKGRKHIIELHHMAFPSTSRSDAIERQVSVVVCLGDSAKFQFLTRKTSGVVFDGDSHSDTPRRLGYGPGSPS